MILDVFRKQIEPEVREAGPLVEDWHDFLPPAFPAANEGGALAIPAFWRAVRLKTGLISTLPLVSLDGPTPMLEQPLILSQPDPTEDVTVTLGRLCSSLVLRGNAFALLGSFDDLGYPRSLKVLSADAVAYEMAADGTYRYRVNGDPVRDEEILHIRGLTLAGEVFGLGCVEVFRRSLSNMTTLEEFSGRYFRDNATPSAVIKNTGDDFSPQEAKMVKAQWIAMQRGNREPVVLNKDLDYTPIVMSNEDSQFLQTKVHSLTDVANIVGVPGYFIGAQATPMTYSNIGQEALNLSKLYLREEIVAIERAFSALMPPGIEARFDLDDLHRSDTLTRYQTYQTGLNAGIITKAEIRGMEGMENLPDTQDFEALDPNALNAVVNLVNNGFDPEDVLKAFNLPAIRYTKPSEDGGVPNEQN